MLTLTTENEKRILQLITENQGLRLLLKMCIRANKGPLVFRDSDFEEARLTTGVPALNTNEFGLQVLTIETKLDVIMGQGNNIPHGRRNKNEGL